MIPRPLMSDAYTISSENLESADAIEYSKYYLTFRKSWAEPPFDQDDQRIIVYGVEDIIKNLLETPITHEEIDEASRFLRSRKASNAGMVDFDFPEEKWRNIVKDFGGYLPLKITCVPEGSTVYPGEPFMTVENTVPGYGQFASMFESTFLKAWATSARATAAAKWCEHYRNIIKKYSPELNDQEIDFLVSISCHDFGDRSGASTEESMSLGAAHLTSFTGTDTFSGAYHAWKRGAEPHVGNSVLALAHRIVQGFEDEADCYKNMYEKAPNGAILSMVADCYDFNRAVSEYLAPLALDAKIKNNQKVIVARPDSSDPITNIMFVIEEAKKAGLFEERNGWLCGQNLRIIYGDGMTFEVMDKIINYLLGLKILPWTWIIFGVGGYLRNSITRDSLSAKYALCSVGQDKRRVMKFAAGGKQTLPDCVLTRDFKDSTLKVLTKKFCDIREEKYLWSGKNISGTPYFSCDTPFMTIRDKVKEFSNNPKTRNTVSEELQDLIDNIKEKYAVQ